MLYLPQDIPNVVFFIHASIDSALSLCGLLAGRVLLACPNYLISFGDQTISNCPCNLIEPTGRISLASFRDLQCHAHDQSCCLSGCFVAFLT